MEKPKNVNLKKVGSALILLSAEKGLPINMRICMKREENLVKSYVYIEVPVHEYT